MRPADPFNTRGVVPPGAARGGWERLGATVPQTRLFDPRQEVTGRRSDGVRATRPPYAQRAPRVTAASKLRAAQIRSQANSVLLQPLPDPAEFVRAMHLVHQRLPTAHALAKRCQIPIERASELLVKTWSEWSAAHG